MKSDAKNFFTSTTDTVYNYISNMQQTFSKLGAAAATPIGWNIQRIVAAQRLTSAATGPSTAGASFVADVFNCMDPNVIPLPLDAAFTGNLPSVLSGGIFEVRGDANNLPAWAWISSGTPASRVVPDPVWGVEPVGGSWPASSYLPAGPYLVFGYPKSRPDTLTLPAAEQIEGKSGFELATLPILTHHSSLRVGVCISTANTDKTTANRLLHSGAIVVNDPPTQLCPPASPTFVGMLAAGLTPTSVLQRFASFFTPTPVFATDFFTGGTPDGWSPFGPGALAGSGIALTFTQPPVNTTISATITVIVQATFNGVPVPGVDLTLVVANNSGVPAGAGIDSGNTTATTGDDGFATFSVSMGKAGGYTLIVSGSLSGVSTQSTTSVLFNVKNQ